MSRVIDCLIVHCADTPDNMDVGRSEIDAWHKARGWKGVGYHFVIRRSGVIEVGRMESEQGAHAEGYNQNSLGICWVGRDDQTDEQHASLMMLLRELMARYKVGPHRVFGHREVNEGRTCPNLDMVKLRAELGGDHA